MHLGPQAVCQFAGMIFHDAEHLKTEKEDW